MGTALGTIERIWRYPIKSTGGEPLDEAAVDARGLVGDRLYAVRDTEGKFGSGKNTRRFRRMPGLLRLRSRYPGGAATAVPELLDPDGDPVPDPTWCGTTWTGTTSKWPARARSRTSTSSPSAS